jgi:hypothetical protein
MGATVESLPPRAQGLRSSTLKRPLSLLSRACRVVVDPDGGVRGFNSLQEKRSLFGYEQIWFYKVQAGIVVHAQRPDWALRVSPRSVQFSGKLFESTEVVQAIEFYRGQSLGFIRRLKLRNGGQAPIRIRVLEILDPTAAHFGDPSTTWGSLGVNAFNRESHVAMDEVSDPPTARVVGATPSPAKFYMTTSKPRAQELLSAGELPEGTAGMSGQVLVLSSHDFELAVSESRELTFASIYNPGKLEEALSDFSRLQSGDRQQAAPRPLLACSEQTITDAAAWASSAVEAGVYSDDALDRYEVLRAVTYFDPVASRKALADARPAVRKDGSLPHALDSSRAGALETGLYLQALSMGLVLAQDKKLARAAYPTVKKLAGYLLNVSKEFSIQTDPGLPQGWRRHLGSGFPTGEIPEISLAAAGALAGASQVARLVSKTDDAARLRERAELLTEKVRKSLIDERGLLALCRDSAGRLRTDETVDMAVAAYRHHFFDLAEQASAHRLLEKDFDTQFGPRCIPTSNQVYFNHAYGRGQLGAVWTRAVLAHAIVCYRAGLAGIGSLALKKVARLVVEDAPRLGSPVGLFPEWVDVEAGEAHGDESDPVAAARFLEAMLEGELGLPSGSEKPSLAPPSPSSLGWVMASDVWAGEPVSAFLGRAGGKCHLFYSGSRIESKLGLKFAKAERLELPARGVVAITFHTPGQAICLGNATGSQARLTVNFAPRAAELSKHLTVPLEEYDPAKAVWSKAGSLRVSPTMTFEAAVEAGGWRAYRVSTP